MGACDGWQGSAVRSDFLSPQLSCLQRASFLTSKPVNRDSHKDNHMCVCIGGHDEVKPYIIHSLAHPFRAPQETQQHSNTHLMPDMPIPTESPLHCKPAIQVQQGNVVSCRVPGSGPHLLRNAYRGPLMKKKVTEEPLRQSTRMACNSSRYSPVIGGKFQLSLALAGELGLKTIYRVHVHVHPSLSPTTPKIHPVMHAAVLQLSSIMPSSSPQGTTRNQHTANRTTPLRVSLHHPAHAAA